MADAELYLMLFINYKLIAGNPGTKCITEAQLPQWKCSTVSLQRGWKPSCRDEPSRLAYKAFWAMDAGVTGGFPVLQRSIWHRLYYR